MEFDNIHTPPATDASRDGYERVWGEGIPKISPPVKKMLYGWIKTKEYGKIILFFTEYCDFTEERSEFLLRELMRGWI